MEKDKGEEGRWGMVGLPILLLLGLGGSRGEDDSENQALPHGKHVALVAMCFLRLE